MKRLLLVATLALVILPVVTQAQVTTYGRVYGTDGVLEWALVRWVGTAYCDTTCPFGNWMLQDLPADDSVMLEAWHQGYYRQTQWVKPGGTSFWLEALPAGVTEQRGDCNLDGNITAADIVVIVGQVFRALPGPLWPDAADYNCDGSVNAADIISVVNYVFRKGDPSSCPGLTRPLFPYSASPSGC